MFIMKITYLNLIFFLLYLLLLQYCRSNNYADPSSYFFTPDRAYTPKFSDVRVAEALNFLDNVKATEDQAASETRANKLHQVLPEKNNGPPKLCVGIPTFGQRAEQYLPKTLASLVDTLTPRERQSIHIIVLIADESPSKHPSYAEPWLRRLADKVLVYDGAINRTKISNHPFADPNSETRLLPSLIKQQKSASDFAHLFDACHNSGAPFFALIEDDITTSRDWYDRSIKAAEALEERRVKGETDWVYLRLFYSETFLGWNNEEWNIYVSGIMMVYVVVAALLASITRFFTKTWHLYLYPFRASNYFGRLNFVVLGLWLPLLITLYFFAGRLSVQPMRQGVRAMPSYGCCSQGLVFPVRHLGDVSDNLRHPPESTMYPDQIIEWWGEDQLLTKWALVPSVLQHIGRMSSSTARGWRKRTWNFRFEKNNG